jgi:hypothetical protein
MTRLSNRQYPMLREFADHNSDYHMSIETAQVFDQRPFRSMLIHKWIAYRPGRGFHITREGRAAWREFIETEIFRKNPTLPLTAYFDATAYGLEMPRRAKVHVMQKGAA